MQTILTTLFPLPHPPTWTFLPSVFTHYLSGFTSCKTRLAVFCSVKIHFPFSWKQDPNFSLRNPFPLFSFTGFNRRMDVHEYNDEFRGGAQLNFSGKGRKALYFLLDLTLERCRAAFAVSLVPITYSLRINPSWRI